MAGESGAGGVMSRLERFFLVCLIVLAVLAVVIVFVVPQLKLQSPTFEQPLAAGETETLPSRVIEILEEGTVDLGGGSTQPYQRLLLRVESGSLAGQEIVVEEGTVNIISQERLFDPGDRVYVQRAVGPNGDRFYVSDFVRTTPLLVIAVLFLGLVVLVGRGRGIRSLSGTLFSLVVIFGFILPQIIAGQDPVLVSVSGAIVMLAVSTYLTYGWNPKAHAAIVGMMLSLVLTGVLAWLFVRWTRLTGLSVEEGAYLVMELGQGIDLRGLVLGGIIIGTLGVLDDICVGQASAVFELVNANRDLSWRELFRSSLNIGRDHIAAMVNTLMLAYVGASMPLMLVFTIYQEPIWRRINREPVAEEIVRTLVGSMGLVLAVPITGLIASLMVRRAVQRAETRR
ncbi:MAG: YibE/F family protein [Chloroflexi bacterium]|nr:YibE/F family protein [Chloroflexota bacterium]